MKKKIVLMLTVIMLIGLAGCGKNQINIKELAHLIIMNNGTKHI